MANLPPSHSIAHSSAAPGPPIAALTVSEDQDKATAEQLVLGIYNPMLRERALRELYMKQGVFQDLAPLLWHSFGTITAILHEIISVYPSLSPPTLSQDQLNRACSALALLQCVAANADTRPLFLDAQIPLYLYPILNTQNKELEYDFLRLTSLRVIGALVEADDPQVIAFLLSSEVIPLCLRTMEMGSVISKTVATFIVQKIMLDDTGLHYVCATSERYLAVVSVLALMVESAERPSASLLKYIICCYLRLTHDARASSLLHKHLPISLIDGTLNKYIQDDHTREKLQQLVYYVSNRSRGGPRGGLDHMMRT